MSRDGRWTTADLDRVAEMRRLGLKLHEIAPVFGSNVNALRQVLWRHRHGKRCGRQTDEVARVRAELIERAEAGQVNASQIAREMGIRRARAHRLLKLAGFDREVRELYARDTDRVDAASRVCEEGATEEGDKHDQARSLQARCCKPQEAYGLGQHHAD